MPDLSEHVQKQMAGAQSLASNLSQLDDRTFVISVGAFIDESLKELCAKVLVEDDEIQKWVKDGSGAISTFSSRIKLARGLGLLTKVEYRDLELLRKMRNNAAHSWEGFTLSSGPEKGRATEISPPQFMAPVDTSPRKKLEARATELIAWLRVMVTWANIPFEDGRIAIPRLKEIGFELKMVPSAPI